MLRRTPFRSKLPPPRPVRQYEGANPSAPRAPVPSLVLIHTPVSSIPKEDIVLSDLRTFPLCGPRYGLLGCHQEFDLGLGLTRDERRVQGARWVERMQALARAAGRKELP